MINIKRHRLESRIPAPILILSRSHPELIAYSRYLASNNLDFFLLTNLVVQESTYKKIRIISKFFPNIDFKIRKRVIPNISKSSMVKNANIFLDLAYRISHKLKIEKAQKYFLRRQDIRFQILQNKIVEQLKPNTIVASEAIDINFKTNARIVAIAFHGHPKYVNSIRFKAGLIHPEWLDLEPNLDETAPIFKIADQIVALSEFSATGIREIEGTRIKSIVIPVGPLLKPIGHAQIYRINNKRITFTYMGRMTMLKGLPNFIRIAEEFKFEADFILCGHASKKVKEKLDEIQNDSLTIHISPSTAKLQNILSTTDAYVSTSFYEGFGIASLEAMSFGCIPICSSHSAIPEILKNSPLAEFIFDPYSYEDLSDKVMKFLNLSPLQRVTLRNYAVEIVRNYSYEKFSHDLNNLISTEK